MRLHSYVVRYDSGFAPNPFFGMCTLATCKPDIRKYAQLGDWVVGTGSAAKKVGRGKHIVYAMQVTGDCTFGQYWSDLRFQRKKPNLNIGRVYSCGDNIYSPKKGGGWHQLNSFHSNKDGSPHQQHIDIDTAVDRVLFSDKFIYFGGEGPKIPRELRSHNGKRFFKKGQGRTVFDDKAFIGQFVNWLNSYQWGIAGRPLEWVQS